MAAALRSAGLSVEAVPFHAEHGPALRGRLGGLGAKDVLVTTRHLGWGSDVHRYRDAEALARELPPRLARDGARVLKASRGNGGRTVWKVRLPGGPSPSPPGPEAPVVVQHAR